MNQLIAYTFTKSEIRNHKLRSRMKAGTQNPVYEISASIFRAEKLNQYAAVGNHPDTNFEIG